MAIDTTLLYAGYNTYELDVGEKLYAKPLDIELHEYITVQLMAIRLEGTATGQFEFRWLDGDGKKIGNDTIVTFDVINKWQRKHQTLTVPENAVKVIPCINNTSEVKWHVACPMVDYGELLRAFDAATASRLNWQDAHGSYVGFFRADQIIAGILRSVIGDSGFNLDEAKIWMTSADGEVKWEATPENPLTVKDKNNNLIAGIMKLANKLGFVSQFISNDPSGADGYGTVGASEDGGPGFEFKYGEHSFLLAFNNQQGTALLLYIDGVLRQSWHADGGTRIRDHEGKVRLQSDMYGTFYVSDGSRIRIIANASAATQLTDSSGNNTLGVDATGAYKIIGGTKTYL